MKCTNCGGILKLKDGVFLCESCGAKQSIAALFENTEVFICYVENDEQGRRTQDSIIAQDLYNKLQSCNINAFYQRISAGDLIEENLDKATAVAISKAKVILVVGTNIDNFEKMMEENRRYFDGKKIIPVYSGINAYDLPEEISSLQAMNYDNIGAATELPKLVLQLLGRADEIDVIKMADERTAKKKKRQRITVIVTTLVILIAAAYIVFFTPYVLKSNKYSYAAELTEEERYIEAINIYNELADYKNAADMLKGVYDKYNGYYKNSNYDIKTAIKITDNKFFEIKCVYEKISFDVTGEFNLNIAKFDFVDSAQHQGHGIIEFKNDGIDITLDISEIGNKTIHYSFDDRTDEDFMAVDKSILLLWIADNMTAEKLQAEGYEIQFDDYIHAQLGAIFSLKNLPIKFFVSLVEGISNENESPIIGISAPANVLCPDKISMKAEAFLDGDTIFIPNGEFPTSSIFSFNTSKKNNIKKGNKVGFFRKEKFQLFLIDEFSWVIMLQDLGLMTQEQVDEELI